MTISERRPNHSEEQIVPTMHSPKPLADLFADLNDNNETSRELLRDPSPTQSKRHTGRRSIDLRKRDRDLSSIKNSMNFDEVDEQVQELKNMI